MLEVFFQVSSEPVAWPGSPCPLFPISVCIQYYILCVHVHVLVHVSLRKRTCVYMCVSVRVCLHVSM